MYLFTYVFIDVFYLLIYEWTFIYASIYVFILLMN